MSDREYKKTSRGIDIITTYLSEAGHNTDHLVFFKRSKIPAKQISSNIKQLYFYDSIKLYRSRLQFLFPGVILLLYFKFIIKRQYYVDFSKYDYVILESGHPIYLGLYISNKIIYRQSDPTSITFNSNRNFYKHIEERVIEKSVFTISALASKYYIPGYGSKIFHWHSGFVPCKELQISKSGKLFFILGGELDWNLLIKFAKTFPNYIFCVVGISTKRKLPKNITIKGYLEYTEYQILLASSLATIVPFSSRYTNRLRHVSFTAKILVSMALGMPVLLRGYGLIQQPEYDKKMFVYKTRKDALALLREIILKVESGELNNTVSENTRKFLLPQLSENRVKELSVIFGRFIK